MSTTFNYLQLMKESPVHVSWPCRLKIGAKTRKGKLLTNRKNHDLILKKIPSIDPHVRIIGRKEDVLRVKDKVMAVLDAKVN